MIHCIELEGHNGGIMFMKSYDTQMIERIKKKIGSSIKPVITKTIIESKYKDIVLKKIIDKITLEEHLQCNRISKNIITLDPNYIIFNETEEKCDLEEIPPTTDLLNSVYSVEIYTITGMSFHFKQMDGNTGKYNLDISFDQYSEKIMNDALSHLCINNTSQNKKQ